MPQCFWTGTQPLAWAPGRESGRGRRMGQQRGRWELQLGKQSLHCSPRSIGLQSGTSASLRTQPTGAWRLAALFTQVSSLPREAGPLQTCVTTCFHKMDAHICTLPRGETEAQSGEGRLSGPSKPMMEAGRADRCSDSPLPSPVTRPPLSCQPCS